MWSSTFRQTSTPPEWRSTTTNASRTSPLTSPWRTRSTGTGSFSTTGWKTRMLGNNLNFHRQLLIRGSQEHYRADSKPFLPLSDVRSCTIHHSHKQHATVRNINPASFISLTGRILKDLSVSPSFFSPSPKHIFSCPTWIWCSLTQRPEQKRVYVLLLFFSILTGRSYQSQCHVTLYSGEQISADQ